MRPLTLKSVLLVISDPRAGHILMSNGISGQVHYRCAFDLTPKQASEAAWSELIKLVREWVSQRVGKQTELGRKWFFAGGVWKPTTPKNFRVQTAACIGNGTIDGPQYWALSYEHPCDDVSFRRWHTDIGITCLEQDRFRFVLTLSNFLRAGFIGEEPSSPVPSAPGIVTRLLQSPRWVADRGGYRLRTTPTELAVGDGVDFVKVLENRDRPPIVLVTLEYAKQKHCLDPKGLAKALAGTAGVYSANSSDVDKELEWLLPARFRCWNGMVRVFQPAVRLKDEGDASRHRFLTARDIQDRSPDICREMFIRGVVRRGRLLVGESVSSVDDVSDRQHEVRLAELRAKSAGQPSQEWVKALEEDNALLDGRMKDLQSRYDALESENEKLEDQASMAEYEKQALKAQLSRVGARDNADKELGSEATTACRAYFDGSPTLTDSLRMICTVWPERIVVLESAWRSAKDAEGFEERKRAAELMLKFATEYWSALSAGGGNAKAKHVFGDKSFAATESETVANNDRAMSLRTFDYNGMPVEMLSHLKIGVKPSVARTWRLHFYWDAKSKKLVIGHCGKHLDHD